jgi:putative transposase
MSQNNTTELIKKYTETLKDLSKLSTEELLVDVLECFFNLERQEHLKKTKNDKGNGFYSRLFQGLSKKGLELKVPRTRLSGFRPTLLELVKRDEEIVKCFALDLYTNGMSSRDTEKMLKRYFSKTMTHTTIVGLSSEYEKYRLEWENRKIDKYFKVVFVDAIHIPLKRGSYYTQEAILIVLGLNQDNKREVLFLDIVGDESSLSYEEIFLKLKDQGLEKIDLVVGDGLKGLPEAIFRVYPKAMFQLCTVHKKRNVLNKVRSKDKERVAADLKHVFSLFKESEDENEGQRRLNQFIKKWSRYYPRIGIHFKPEFRQYLFTYTKFEPEIRRYIYTTNNIENLNSMLRKSVRNKYSFKNETNLLNYLFIVLMNHQEKNLLKYEISQFRSFGVLEGQTQLT